MGEVSVQEMQRLLECLEEVLQQQGEIVITREGKPVARVVPVENNWQRRSHRELRQKIRPLHISSAQILRQERDEK